MQDAPVGLRLSVVIPSKNQGEFLEETLRSLFDQRDIARDALEIIVIDGGSTDASAEIIARYADRIAYRVSEPDEGQTHALIKGFAVAKGDILAWLCSDDLIEPDLIEPTTSSRRFPGITICPLGARRSCRHRKPCRTPPR